MGVPAGSTAERVAARLRGQITEGVLRPGVRLSEDQLVASTGVSRNTLREAFRLLAHERLLVHRLHRGVFVPELDEDDLTDLYRLRRSIQCDVLRRLDHVDPLRLQGLAEQLELAEEAAAADRWVDVGTANMRFHQQLVGLGGSRRMEEVARTVLAELRLLFSVIELPEQLHRPYLGWNRALHDLLVEGRYAEAAAEMERYLTHSETTLLGAYRGLVHA